MINEPHKAMIVWNIYEGTQWTLHMLLFFNAFAESIKAFTNDVDKIFLLYC